MDHSLKDHPKGFLAQLGAYIRTGHWWQYKAAPLLGFVYLFIHLNHISLVDSAVGILMSVITILGIAGTGYFINDLYDIEFDRAAGKTNRIGGLAIWQRLLLLGLLLTAAALPWLWLPFDGITIGMIAFQFSLYLLYSHPWVRFKEKHLLGALCDALYGHAMPALIAMYTFHKIGHGSFYRFDSFMGFTFTWLLVKGLRNIIIHQIEDRRNDRTTHFETFVLWYGSLRSVYLLNWVLIPLEFSLLGMWLWLLSINMPVFAVTYLLFLMVGYGKFSGWKLQFLPYRQLWFQFVYWLNDYYEDWLPLTAVLYLAAADVYMLAFVVVHLLLFPGVVFRLWSDVKLIGKNLQQGRADEQSRLSYFKF